jgi:hypothetical protein
MSETILQTPDQETDDLERLRQLFRRGLEETASLAEVGI